MNKILLLVFVFVLSYQIIVIENLDESQIEEKVFELVNKEREGVGLGVLVRENGMDEVAKKHSVKMRDGYFFGHSETERGENIYHSPILGSTRCGFTLSNDDIARCMVNGWVESPVHYSNIVSSEFSYTGVGVSCNFIECFGTQNFG